MTNSLTRSALSRFGVLSALGCALLLLWLPAAGATNVHSTAGGEKNSTVHYLRVYSLTNPKLAHWAVVVKPALVHAAPSSSSRTVTKLSTVTSDGTQNLVLILSGVDLTRTQTWYKVRLPILPNNTVGWVPRNALGTVYAVNTHLYVNRETQTLTLKRNGVTVFTTRVGVGTSADPTPVGEYYIRDKLTDFNNPAYGPIAFGTSARSPTLASDWPGGAFIGVHGTNEPQILPGYVSHGCIRLLNSAIVRLAHLMKVGSPLTIT